jgi:hypothetical protein
LLLKPVVHQTGLSSGKIRIQDIELECKKQFLSGWQQHCPNGKYAAHKITQHQQGILRFNCADSLDRTNIATFCKENLHLLQRVLIVHSDRIYQILVFTFQLMAEMCRLFRVGLNESFAAMNNMDLHVPYLFMDQRLPILRKSLAKPFINTLAEFFGL